MKRLAPFQRHACARALILPMHPSCAQEVVGVQLRMRAYLLQQACKRPALPSLQAPCAGL
jgi:hypothetical protein